VSAFGAPGGRHVFETEQVIPALHLIGDVFFGDAVASAFLADHGNLVWSDLTSTIVPYKHVFRIWQLVVYVVEIMIFYVLSGGCFRVVALVCGDRTFVHIGTHLV
jgi:hypothetical protein